MHAKYQFLQIRRTQDEPIISYNARLREKAKKCEFENELDERILEHIIHHSERFQPEMVFEPISRRS